jgi:hypothetical protein
VPADTDLPPTPCAIATSADTLRRGGPAFASTATVRVHALGSLRNVLYDELAGMSNRKGKRKQTQPRADDEARLIHETDSDTDYYFIFGYTSNDVPYGITWEEAREQGLIDERPSDDPSTSTD